MNFSIKDSFSKCDQICRKLQYWSHLPKKSFMQNFIVGAVSFFYRNVSHLRKWTLIKPIQPPMYLQQGREFFNPFHATDLFWYPLKTSENQRFKLLFMYILLREY